MKNVLALYITQKKTLMHTFLFNACLFISLIFILSSCEIGLGSAVDTDAPVISITGPDADSIIRDSFKIQGDWSDDGEIGSLTCVLTNTKNTSIRYELDSVLEKLETGKGTWSVLVEKGAVVDGTYESVITIEDTAGHATSVTRQMTIDNTAPVVILQRPSSRKNDTSDIDSYGQIFSIEGQAADDSGVGLVEVNIYSDENLTNLLKTVSIKNVPRTISLDVAKFVEGEENDYSAIYGSTSRTAGEAKRWCTVTAYDGAVRYPLDGEQTESDLKGNASEGYYLYEDISASVLSEYKIDELYAMKNGTYSGENAARSATLSTLGQKEISAGVFTLNPANNPLFTVAGYSELKKDGTDFGEDMYVSNGNFVTVEVSPGLDSYLLVKDSLKVKVIPCDAKGNAISSGAIYPSTQTITKSGTSYKIVTYMNREDGLNINQTYIISVEGYDEKGNEVNAKGNGYGFLLSTNGVSPTINVTEPKNETSVTYNKEKSLIEIKGSAYFPSESCGGGLVLIKDSTGKLEWLVGSYINDDEQKYTDQEQPWSISIPLKKDSPDKKNEDGIAYLPDGNHALYVYAIAGDDFNDTEYKVSVTRNFLVDTQIPGSPVLEKINGGAFDEEKWYTGTSLPIVVSTEDAKQDDYASGLYSVECSTDQTDWNLLTNANGQYSGNVSFKSGGSGNALYFRATDYAGNVSEISKIENIKIDTKDPVLTVEGFKVDADGAPVASTAGGETYVNGKNAFIVWGVFKDEESGAGALGFTFGGEAVSATIEYSAADLTLDATGLPANEFGGYDSIEDKTTIKSWKAIIPANELKDGSLVAEGTDTAGRSATCTVTRLIKDELPPKIESITMSESSGSSSVFRPNAEDFVFYVNNASGNKFTLKGISSDGRAVDNTKLTIGDVTYAQTNTSWSFTDIDLSAVESESIALNVTVTDKAGNQTAQTVTVKFDTKEPVAQHIIDAKGKDLVFRIGDTDVGGKYRAGTWGNSSSMTVRGYFKDGEDGSGLKAVYYKKFTTKPTTEQAAAFLKNYSTQSDGVLEALATEETKSVEYNTTTDGDDKQKQDIKTNFRGSITKLVSGSNYVLLVAVDNVGNASLDSMSSVSAAGNLELTDTMKSSWNNSLTCYSLNVDVTPPTLTSSSGGTKYTNGKSPITISGTVSDNEGGSGIKSEKDGGVTVSVTIGGNKKTGTVTLEKDADGKLTGKWTAVLKADDLKDVADGSTYNVEAVATDEAENTGSLTVCILQGDLYGPSIERGSISPSAVSASDGYYVNPAAALVVKGNSDDTYSNKITTWLKLVPYKNETEATDKVYTSETSEARSWSFEVPADEISKYTENAAYDGVKLYICAEDAAGTTTVTEPVTLEFDAKGPEFKSESAITDYEKPSVGGKTFTENGDYGWHNNTSLLFKGIVNDNAGIAQVFYQVVTEGSTKTITKENCTNGSYQSFTTTRKGNGLEVFSMTFSGFAQGTNTVFMYAQDSLGNLSEEKPFIVNVDTTPPVITEKAAGDFEKTYITNAKDDITLQFYVEDGLSGINTATAPDVRLGSSVIDFSKNNSAYGYQKEGDRYAVTLTLGKDDLSALSGNKVINFTVKDNAGNPSVTSIGSVNIDTTLPVVEITTPKANATLNKTVTVSGKITEVNNISSVKLTATANGNTQTFTYPSESGSGELALEDKTWSITLDTTALYNGTDTAELTISVTATDEAGNKSTDTVAGRTEKETVLTCTIDQKSDCPTIRLAQIAANTTTTLRSKSVPVSVEDDDGEVNCLWYYSGSATNKPAEAPSLNGGSWTVPAGWNRVTLTDYMIQAKEDDGDVVWYFAVADAHNSVFWSLANNLLERPNIKYKDDVLEAQKEGGIAFKFDTIAPSIEKLYLYRAATGTAITAAQIMQNDTDSDSSNNIDWSEDDNMAFGGKYNVMYAKVVVKEATGMKALSGTAKAEPVSAPIELSYVNKDGERLHYEQIAESPNPAEGTYTYYLGPLVMNTTEAHGLKITVYDAVENEGHLSRNIIVDNTAPTTISNVKPGKSEEVTGEVTFRGSVGDNINGSGILSVEYYIPKYAQSQANNPAGIADESWQETSLGAVSWEIEFKNLGSDVLGYDSKSYSVSDDFKGYKDAANEAFYNVPVWFRLTDAVGNVGYNTENYIRYNPDADRPTVQITYPTHDDKKEYVTMGGTINISGAANDDDGISAVYLQFDLDGDGTYENGIKEGTAMIDGCPWKYEDVVTIPVQGGKGIKTKGTKSWYYTMNISALKGLNMESDSKCLKVRAVAIEYDSEKESNGQDFLYSAWSETLNISVNNQIPTFSKMYLNKYTTAPTNATLAGISPAAQDEYVVDKYIKGSETTGTTQWYLTGSVTVQAEKIDALTYSQTSSSENKEPVYYDSADGKTRYFAIPITLGAASSGKWEITLNVQDTTAGTPMTNREKVTLNLDGTPPSFTDVVDKAAGTVTLYKNGYGTEGIALSATDSNGFVQNKSGAFTLAGRITEDGSGFERLAFYFLRNGKDGTMRIYNPMESHGTNNKANRTDLATEKADAKVYINAEGMPALYLESVTRSDDYTITSASLQNNANVRAGGLVKIGGVYHLIDKVDYANGKVTLKTSCVTTFTQAEFIYAMVVDHNGETEKSDGTISGDDGDGMLESYVKSGNNYTWDATVNSKNIPDGPIEIHCVVFDAAGNSSHGYTATKVSNNPPRITSVMLGTDLNRDGKYSVSEEFDTFWVYTNDDKKSGDTTAGKDIWNLDTKEVRGSYWTAKKDLVLIPEFVGGSGDMYYTYSKSTDIAKGALGEAEKGSLEGTATLQKLLAANENIIDSASSAKQYAVEASQADNKAGAIILKNGDTDGLGTISTSTGEDSANVYRFSFWDSTEECTVGQDTSWSVLNLIISQDLADGKAPVGSITPFYWKSATENSLYENSTENGHIELEADLPITFTAGGTGLYDRDPKVSGKIKVEGTAYDETLLNTITVSFANSTATATYDSGNWTYAGNTENFSLEVTGGYGPTQSGHSVSWVLAVDTAKVITSVAATDQSVTVTVTDANPNSSTPSTYRMDVVPYITEVGTALSPLYRSAPSVYARTALGHYPVHENESITIKGFNIAAGNAVYIVADDDNTAQQLGTLAASGDGFAISVGNTFRSGKLEIRPADGITSLNNVNNNDATFEGNTSNVYAGYYNRQPNGVNNNVLTDDVCIDIWQFQNVAEPKNGKSQNPTMKISSKGRIGVSFSNAVVYFSAPFVKNGAQVTPENVYTQTAIAKNYGWFTNNTFCFDPYGLPYASAQCPDTDRANAAAFMQFFSRQTGTTIDNMDLVQNYRKCRNSTRIEGVSIPLNEDNNNWTTDIDRTQSIAMVASMPNPDAAPNDDDNRVTVHIAYYDNLTKQVRYRQGKVGVNPASFGGAGQGALADLVGGGADVHLPWLKGATDESWDRPSVYDSIYPTLNTNIRQRIYRVAGSDIGTIENQTPADAYRVNTPHRGGRYVDIGVLPTTAKDNLPTVVICWYDGVNKELVLSYDTPNDSDGGDAISDDGMTVGNWATNARTISTDGGMYCRMAIDADNGIHIAHYDNSGADLLYTYVPCQGGVPQFANAKTMVVDSFLSVGTYCTIDVAKDKDTNGNYVPRIGYFVPASQDTTAAARIAYPVQFVNNIAAGAGAEKDMFTGNWEVSVVPTTKNPITDRVNVGVHKNANGVIQAIPTGNRADETETNDFAVSNSTRVFGNGTTNPAVVYSVDDGPVEMAQKK